MLLGIWNGLHSLIDRIVSKILKEPETLGQEQSAPEVSQPPAVEPILNEPPPQQSGSGVHQNIPPRPAPPLNIAGMKTRKTGDADRTDQIIHHDTDDTVYVQRNEIVKVVYDRYAKFGDKIASAVLSKAFLPNGLVMMLAKLELDSIGVAMADHDQVVDWIDENGVEVFCKKMGIRMEAPHQQGN